MNDKEKVNGYMVQAYLLEVIAQERAEIEATINSTNDCESVPCTCDTYTNGALHTLDLLEGAVEDSVDMVADLMRPTFQPQVIGALEDIKQLLTKLLERTEGIAMDVEHL